MRLSEFIKKRQSFINKSYFFIILSRNLGQLCLIFVLRNNNQTLTVMEKRTERRKHFLHTNIAGFMYWDGCEAFSKLEIGTKLELVREADNKHDCDAVALYYKDYKLGFIPGSENEIFAQFLDMGHSDLFEVRVCRLCPDAHPERQVYINIYIKRNEK